MMERDLRQLADRVVTRARSEGSIDADSLDPILGAALSDDETTSLAGTGAFFGGVVEPLCDSFDADNRRSYYRVMARAIDTARARSSRIAGALDAFGLRTEDDLVARTARVVRGGEPAPSEAKRIYLISRVTLGADVAVTSRAIPSLRQTYPGASIHLVGGAKLADLFGGDPDVVLERLDYPRRGGLLARLEGWLQAVRFFEERGFFESDLLIDPDTRISQVGLLPLVKDESRYRFFEGVTEDGADERPLGEVFGAWIEDTFGAPSVGGPAIFLRESDRDFARSVFDAAGWRGDAAVAISFGVGGNENKRAGFDFERDLALALLDRGLRLVVDHGGSPDEAEQVAALLRAIDRHGYRTASFREGEPVASVGGKPHVITWEGGIGPFAALIEKCRGYAGYDSLFQHVAAAVGVDVATVFTGYANPVFPLRWRPAGPARVHVFAFGPEDSIPGDLARRVADAFG